MEVPDPVVGAVETLGLGVAAIVAVEPVVGGVAEPVVGLVVPDAVVVAEPVAGLVAVVAVAPDEAELVVAPEGAAEPVALVAVLVVPFAALAVVAAAVVEVAEAAPYRPGSRPSGLDTVSSFTATAVGSFE